MYKDYLYLKDCKDNIGKGIFTKIDIPKEMPIIQIIGELHTEKSMPDPNHPAWLQVSNVISQNCTR